MTSPQPTPILDFFRNFGRDSGGRTFDAGLALDDDALERTHDYIQWWFPLREPSLAVPGAPVLTAVELEALRTDATLRARGRAAWVRMLAFYGLVVEGVGDSCAVRRSERYAQRSADWLSRPHNFMRLTRIFKSLMLRDFEPEARMLFAALAEIYAENTPRIGRATFDFWREAVESSDPKVSR